MTGRTQPFVLTQGNDAINAPARPFSDDNLAELIPLASQCSDATLRGVNVVVGSPHAAWQLCNLMELAPLECKFASDKQLKWGTPVLCAFCDTHSNQLQQVTGRVHWCRKVKSTWHIGVFLDTRLQDMFFDAMGDDVRSLLRYETQWPAEIQFAGSSQRHGVVVQDYCVDGVSFTGDLPHPVAPRFSLFRQDDGGSDAIATGTVLWQRAAGENQTMIGARASGQELSWYFAIRQD